MPITRNYAKKKSEPILFVVSPNFLTLMDTAANLAKEGRSEFIRAAVLERVKRLAEVDQHVMLSTLSLNRVEELRETYKRYSEKS